MGLRADISGASDVSILVKHACVGGMGKASGFYSRKKCSQRVGRWDEGCIWRSLRQQVMTTNKGDLDVQKTNLVWATFFGRYVIVGIYRCWAWAG